MWRRWFFKNPYKIPKFGGKSKKKWRKIQLHPKNLINREENEINLSESHKSRRERDFFPQNLTNREENEIYFSKSHKSRREREFSLKIFIIENRKRNENSIFSSERERERSVFLEISRDSRLLLMPASHPFLSPLNELLDHTNHIFSESAWSKDIKTVITKCLIQKDTNTDTQIHKYTHTAYDKVPEKNPTRGIFLKRGFFKDMKNYIPKCQTHKYKIHKYTNAACDKVNCFRIYGIHCCWLFAPLTKFII